MSTPQLNNDLSDLEILGSDIKGSSAPEMISSAGEPLRLVIVRFRTARERLLRLLAKTIAQDLQRSADDWS